MRQGAMCHSAAAMCAMRSPRAGRLKLGTPRDRLANRHHSNHRKRLCWIFAAARRFICESWNAEMQSSDGGVMWKMNRVANDSVVNP